MPQVLDTFELEIVADTDDIPPVLPTFVWKDNNERLVMVQGESTGMGYSYSMGQPKAHAWVPITASQGSIVVTGRTAPGGAYQTAAPPQTYDNDNNPRTPEIDRPPRLYFEETATIYANNAAVGVYSMKGGIENA